MDITKFDPRMGFALALGGRCSSEPRKQSMRPRTFLSPSRNQDDEEYG